MNVFVLLTLALVGGSTSNVRSSTDTQVMTNVERMIGDAPNDSLQSLSSPVVDSILAEVVQRIATGLDSYPVTAKGIPRTLKADRSVKGVSARDWTSGFFPGILWQLYGYSGDPAFRSAATAWTSLLESEVDSRKDHDIGFRIYSSFGWGWRLTRDSTYRTAVVRAARALASRFNPEVGAIKSWDYDDRGWIYPVIIDNMMNLELLFAATRLTGDSTYYEIADRHAKTTLSNHFRDEGSSFHVVDYDPEGGAVRRRHTHQGAEDSSAWARGQSWGLYGFTMAYRETRDPVYLSQARKIASFLLNHPNLPGDGIPYWDYDAPGIPDADRDVSAAAIMASALYELRDYVPAGESSRYDAAAERIILSLWGKYRASEDAWPFVLVRSVGNMNIQSEVGVPIIYADYYFIEALRRRPPYVEPAEPFDREHVRAHAAAAWDLVPGILAKIRAPEFPARECVVTDFGATPDSSMSDDRPAIMAAVAACSSRGGGRVVLPPGDYLANGPIHLESNIELHLSKGTRLRFGTDPESYTPLVLTRWEGTFAYNYSPLIYALRKENVAITGEGVIDGQTEGTWSRWKRDNEGRNQETPGNKPRLRRMGSEDVPVEQRIFGNGNLDLDGDGMNDGDGNDYYLRPSLVQFVQTRNVLVEGVTLMNSPFWTTHFVLCENVIVRGTTIRHGTTNDDGIDPDGSRYVLIEDNDIDVDDDAIAIKAGRDEDGRRYPGTAYVVIRKNRLRSTVGGAISIGSEMSGGVEWVFIENNMADNENGHGLYIKSNMDRGGFVRNVYVRDLDIVSAAQGFEVTSDYHGYRGGNSPADVHDVFLEDVIGRSPTEAAIRLLGQPGSPVRRIYMRNVDFIDSRTRPELRITQDILTDDVTIHGEPWTPPQER